MTNKHSTYLLNQKASNVIILAGGNSSRMKFPKSWLPFDNKKTFLEQIVDQYLSIGCNQIVLVINDSFVEGYDKYISKIKNQVSIVRNFNPEHGRMHSLQLGIKSLESTESAFIHNVDNPYANKETLKSLLKSKYGGYTRPVCNKRGGHPILVSNGVLENILHADKKVLLNELLKEHSCTDIQVDDQKVLFNCNTPEQYHQHFGMKIPEIKPINHGSLV